MSLKKWLKKKSGVMPTRHLIILYEYLRLESSGKKIITDQDLRELLLPCWDKKSWNYENKYWHGGYSKNNSLDEVRHCENWDFDEDLDYLQSRGYILFPVQLDRRRKEPIAIQLTYRTVILFKEVFPTLYYVPKIKKWLRNQLKTVDTWLARAT